MKCKTSFIDPWGKYWLKWNKYLCADVKGTNPLHQSKQDFAYYISGFVFIPKGLKGDISFSRHLLFKNKTVFPQWLNWMCTQRAAILYNTRVWQIAFRQKTHLTKTWPDNNIQDPSLIPEKVNRKSNSILWTWMNSFDEFC